MINLLPPEIKNRYRTLSRIYFTIFILFGLSVSTVLGGLSVMTYSVVQNNTIFEKQAAVEQLMSSQKQHKATIEKAAFVESRINNHNQYREKINWEELLETIALSTPVDVRLTTTDLDVKESKITLVGEAANQRSIILFRDKLQTNSVRFSKAEITNINEGALTNKLTFSISIKLGVPNEK